MRARENGYVSTYHAWQHPDIGVAPDIQMIGKTLGGGYMPIAGVLIGKKVASAMVENNGLVITLAGPWLPLICAPGFSSMVRRTKIIRWHVPQRWPYSRSSAMKGWLIM